MTGTRSLINVLKMIMNFFDSLQSSLSRHTPMTKPPKQNKSIYITNEAIHLKNAKHRAWKRYLSTRTKHDRDSYTSIKNKLRISQDISGAVLN